MTVKAIKALVKGNPFLKGVFLWVTRVLAPFFHMAGAVKTIWRYRGFLKSWEGFKNLGGKVKGYLVKDKQGNIKEFGDEDSLLTKAGVVTKKKTEKEIIKKARDAVLRGQTSGDSEKIFLIVEVDLSEYKGSRPTA